MQVALWLLVLAAPTVLYFTIVRPRLHARFFDVYAHLDSFWARLLARLYAFRSLVAATVSAWAIAIPPLLELVGGMDLAFLPQPWPAYVSGALSIYLTVNRAFATKPGEER